MSGSNNKTVILSCTSLKDYIEETQRKLGTDIPVVYVSKIYHRDPQEMRGQIIERLAKLSDDIDTVLISMGYCGGSWKDISCNKRLVLPKIDDCVSLLLQIGDEPISDLKEPKHFYVRDKDPSKESIKTIFERMAAAQDLDEATIEKYHKHWQEMYEEIDIIETSINDSREQEYYNTVKTDADWLDAAIEYVPGGIHLLEKLLNGDWDEQFLVIEPGDTVTKEKMLI